MKPLMLAGTGSGVGKSLLTGGLCRLFADMGIKTAPFKAQNMSLNGGRIADGLEMSRAQVLQAEAAGIIPDPRMNPILLKPVGDAKSVMVRMGREVNTLSAADYYKLKEENFKIATDAFNSLSADYDLIVLEGAGSPAEINLMEDDIVNMRMADYADAAVVLIGDISRGGVFASLKGTFDLIGDYQRLVHGFIINKFRGDRNILAPGLKMLEDMTTRPVLGVLDWFEHTFEEEDSLDSRNYRRLQVVKGVRAGIIDLPRGTGYALRPALNCYRNLEVRVVSSLWDLQGCEIVILPESLDVGKSAKYLNESGLGQSIKTSLVPVIAVGTGKEVCAAIRRPADMNIDSSEDFNKPATVEQAFKYADADFKALDNPRAVFDSQWKELADRIAAEIDIHKLLEHLKQ